MSEAMVYEIDVRSDEAEQFLDVATSHLERAGFEVKVHLHEPPHQMEILEFAREEEVVSVEINRHEMDACSVKVSSPGLDPHPLVLDIVSELCATIVSTFVKPIVGKRAGESLEKRVKAGLKDIIESCKEE